jgi:serine/threonine-protein kinase
MPGYQYGPPDEPPQGSGRRRALLWTLFALLVLGTVIAVAYFVLAGGGKTYAVPDVTGLSVDKATKQIVANHLQPQIIKQTSSTVQANDVINTSPSAGTLLPANSVVKVYVSAGQKKVAVPNVVGEDQNTAENKLQALGLNPELKTVRSTKPANTVVSQQPVAGTSVKPNSTVVLDVSGGGTTVQSVVGDPVATAKSILQGQGFQVNEVEQPGPTTAAVGTVYAQNPQGGALATPGSTITIYVQPAAPSTPPTSPTPTPTTTPTGTPTGTSTPPQGQ